MLDLHRYLGALTLLFLAGHLGRPGRRHLHDVDARRSGRALRQPLEARCRWRWGIIAAWLLVAVEVSSLLLRHLPRVWWRRLHLTSYAGVRRRRRCTSWPPAPTPSTRRCGCTVAAAAVAVGALTAFRIRQGRQKAKRRAAPSAGSGRRPVPSRSGPSASEQATSARPSRHGTDSTDSTDSTDTRAGPHRLSEPHARYVRPRAPALGRPPGPLARRHRPAPPAAGRRRPRRHRAAPTRTLARARSSPGPWRRSAPGAAAAGRQRHRRAAPHEPRPGARSPSTRRPAATNLELDLATGKRGSRQSRIAASCWPGSAAPRRPSSSTTTPPPCCWCWPPWPPGARCS